MSASSAKKLSKEERHALISDVLTNAPTLRISELAKKAGVSTETIRRDLAELEGRGLISRTYGGASRPLNVEPKQSEREKLFLHQRDLIASYAVNLIEDGAVIILGSGSTTVHVAAQLAARKRELTIFTDSISAAAAAAVNPLFKVHLCPGIYSAEENCVYGPETIHYLQRVYANWAILGASGLTEEGPNNADLQIGLSYQVMVQRASKTIIVADHSKISRQSVFTYAPWQSIDSLIIDTPPYDEELISALRLGNVNIIEASENWARLK
ncbi:MAG: DeoR/GlpR family DNA-binding transcription regulator [Candidatus Anaerobiospirillum merdipullorum]|uniref:DeoR/GlpR family DNA-binding transcription regulator n=1 Tax=Candidatus Anaerobiospirillum merdipullorum TaxID=2838450 RepID=A0A9E2NSN5_9GAMM|nr:DeoR/GlpR family DNA-binding transcription regulator [Candidatus Anaerobiospirillum merdipullorum]